MTAQHAEHVEPLTDLQRAVIERARQAPFTVSRSHSRIEPGTEWTHEPFATVSDEIDILSLLDAERNSMIADTTNAEQGRSDSHTTAQHRRNLP